MELTAEHSVSVNLGRILAGNQDQILRQWEVLVRREVAAAKDRSQKDLWDGLPKFLSALADQLTHPSISDQYKPKIEAIAQEHGLHRSTSGTYVLDQVICEYELLRRVIFRFLEPRQVIPSVARDTILDALYVGMASACAVFRELREKQDAEAAEHLRAKAVSQLKLIMDTQPTLISYIDADYRYQFVNRTYEEFFGVKAEEIVGRTIPELIGPDLFASVRNNVDRALRGEVVRSEEKISYPVKGERYVLVNFIPDVTPQGAVVGFFASVIDQTAQKEEAFALKESEERLSLALAASKVGIWEHDFKSGLNKWTPEQAKLYGYPPMFMTITQDEFSDLIHPDDLEMMNKSVASSIESHEHIVIEFRIKRRDGEIRWIHGNSRVHFDHLGNPVRLLGTNRDITDEKFAREELREAKADAERASKAKSQFLAHMSHEIRTPLGAILGFTDLLRARRLSETERFQYTETILRNGRQLGNLINDLLDLSKVESGKLEIEHVVFPLCGLMTEITEFLKPIANDRGIKIEVRKESTDHPLSICSDPTRFRQIVTNLLSNAVKFTGDGGEVTVSVRFEVRDGSQFGIIDVADNGIGMTLEQQEKLFQNFTQADSSTARKFGGTGLGLVLSKSLARLLDGDLSLLRSEPGKGSTFRFSFRALTPNECSASHHKVYDPKWVPAPMSKGGSLNHVRVLIAEDSQDNRFLLKHYLEAEGAHLDFATDGNEAVTMALAQIHDLVLMDIQMPIMDGYRATQVLREKGFEKPIIALTAHALSTERRQALDAGCNEHLTKPIDRTRLIDTVKRFSPSMDEKSAN